MILCDLCYILLLEDWLRSAPLLLASAKDWGALWALLEAFGPFSVEEASKQNILNLGSK